VTYEICQENVHHVVQNKIPANHHHQRFWFAPMRSAVLKGRLLTWYRGACWRWKFKLWQIVDSCVSLRRRVTCWCRGFFSHVHSWKMKKVLLGMSPGEGGISPALLPLKPASGNYWNIEVLRIDASYMKVGYFWRQSLKCICMSWFDPFGVSSGWMSILYLKVDGWTCK
jgi:hypothetical protein